MRLISVVLLIPALTTSLRAQQSGGSAIERVVAAYGQAWNEPVLARRDALLQQAWADQGRYTDPTADVLGRQALSAHIARFLADNRGTKIELTSTIDSHHGLIRFTWRMVGKDGSPLGDGMDFGEIGPDGRLSRIVGFFGPPRPLE